MVEALQVEYLAMVVALKAVMLLKLRVLINVLQAALRLPVVLSDGLQVPLMRMLLLMVLLVKEVVPLELPLQVLHILAGVAAGMAVEPVAGIPAAAAPDTYIPQLLQATILPDVCSIVSITSTMV